MTVRSTSFASQESSADEQNPRPGLNRRDLLRRAGMTAGTALAAGMLLQNGTSLKPPSAAASARTPATPRPNVILVHGAWVDGSSWNEVIALLLKFGYPVMAAAIPLSSLADDVARTRALLALQTGPTVLVGHSIGGAVISGAGFDQPNVKALVFVSAFAPDQGETIGQLAGGSGFPPAPGTAPSSLVPDEQGFLYLQRDAYLRFFAPDVFPPLARIMAATQRPIAGSYLNDQAGPAAWKTLPSWFLISTNDQMINPDLQRFEAKRMGATTLEVASSHASPVSHPFQVFQLITEAARVAVTA